MVKKVKPHNYWTKERCAKELAKYTRKLDAKRGSPSAYNPAYHNGWLEEIAPHLQSKTYWTKEKCFEEVKKHGYKTKKEFHEGSPGCYSYAQKHGLIDELCKNMEVLGNYNLRKIYVFEFDDGFAYVGLTCNTKKRLWQHLNEKDSPVYKHIQETNSKYTFKILTDWLKMKAAQKAEDHMIKEYAHQGWKMLNTKKGGALGSAREPKYKLAELIEEAKKYKKRSDFEHASPAKYAFATAHGLLDIVCAHMPKHYYPTATIWTKERLDEVYEECGHSRDVMREKYPLAILTIMRKDLVPVYFGKKRITKTRTFEEALNECLKYKTIRELMDKDSALCSYVYRKGWSDVCFKHLAGHSPKKVDRSALTWSEIEDKIKQCATRKEMRTAYPAEYRTAIKNPEWRARLNDLLPIRNGATFDEVYHVCLKYKTPVELQKANLRIFNTVLRNHWQKECFAHMPSYKAPAVYTWEEILVHIKSCAKLKEFTEKYRNEYYAILRRKDWKKKLYQYLPSNKKSSNVQ